MKKNTCLASLITREMQNKTRMRYNFSPFSLVKIINFGDFHAGQWLKVCTSTPGDVGFIPDQGTKILQATWCAPPKKDYEVCSHFSSTYTKFRMTQWGLAWSLGTDDMQINDKSRGLLYEKLIKLVLLRTGALYWGGKRKKRKWDHWE